MDKKYFIISAVIVVIIFGGIFWYQVHSLSTTNVSDKTVVYSCDAGKSITATFHLPADQNVSLVLSDGRNETLPHAISADGARYANSDESFVFWNVGNTAFITEGLGNSATTTFANCVEATN